MLAGKTVLLCVSGSIAAYKIAYLASALKKLKADVHVLMTRNATNFINPITFETLTGNKCLVDTFDRNFEFSVDPLMRIYVQAHTYVHAGPHIYTRRPIRTFTQACAYIRVDTCILSTLPAYSPSLNTPFAGRHLKMINISSHRHLDGTRQGLEDSFYLMMFIISFCLDIEIHTCCITQ